MSIVAADLQAYASANMTDTDSGTTGGAIDTLRRVAFTQQTANGTIRFRSSSAGDTTQTLTIEGRKADGTIVSETLTMNGVTNVTTVATYERVIKLELSATCAGTVTVERGAGVEVVATIAIGERGCMAIFRKCSSSTSGTTDYYEKFFWKNTHATLALLSALVKENADPDARITHALDATQGASTSVTNRITTPGFTFDGTDKAVPSTDLGATNTIGVWLKLSLPINDAAHRTTYTSQLAGSTT